MPFVFLAFPRTPEALCSRFPRFFSKVIKCWPAGPQLPRWKMVGVGLENGKGMMLGDC